MMKTYFQSYFDSQLIVKFIIFKFSLFWWPLWTNASCRKDLVLVHACFCHWKNNTIYFWCYFSFQINIYKMANLLLMVPFAYADHIEVSVLNWDCFITSYKLIVAVLMGFIKILFFFKLSTIHSYVIHISGEPRDTFRDT